MIMTAENIKTNVEAVTFIREKLLLQNHQCMVVGEHSGLKSCKYTNGVSHCAVGWLFPKNMEPELLDMLEGNGVEDAFYEWNHNAKVPKNLNNLNMGVLETAQSIHDQKDIPDWEAHIKKEMGDDSMLMSKAKEADANTINE